MKGILGKKLGMTQVFLEDGTAYGVTVIQAGPCKVTQVRSQENDGYEAVQLGFGQTKAKNNSKAELGHFAKSGLESAPMHVVELPYEGDAPSVGTDITVSMFEGVKKVIVRGTSKGRGFAGTIKRYNFQRGRETHGNVNHRAPGSAGQHTYPARTIPGKKFPGHMGNHACTTKNLQLVKYDAENNLLFVRGAVPGPINGLVIVEKI
ncbi:MAG: 50S ribosomal protein L3 [Fibrobacterota bacterium]|nr:50S ribosomal protein L3 [Fibrobacterota bacterium]QQS06854.1 MAG: 50S ribosomal protein L3 [Fibrobacterota bacterium]